MSVSTGDGVDFLPDGYGGLPAGLRPFTKTLTTTGDATGNHALHNFRINPGSKNSQTPFVTVTRVAWSAAVADVGSGVLEAQSNSWQRYSDISTSPIAALPRFDPIASGATTWGGQQRINVEIGRPVPGTTGEIVARFSNVNTAVVKVTIWGFCSDRPIIVPSTINW